jgi:hypothetical protein
VLRYPIFSLLIVFVLHGMAWSLPADQDDRLEDIGVFTPLFFAELQDIELLGDRAYAFGVGGLAVIDISLPEVPTMVGRYEPFGHPFERFYRGAVEGNLALGGGREDLLSVLDLSSGGDPVLITVVGQPGQSYEGVALRSGIGYACRHADGLQIITFDANGTPTIQSEVLSLVNAWDISLQGDFAYIADGMGGLAVLDITDAANPVHLASLTTSGAATDVSLEGNVAVVCCGSAGIDVFTLDDPANPALSGHANTSGLAITADIVGDVVYVADWDDVETFDVTNPADPILIGGENTPVRSMGLAARDGLVVVADWSRLRTYRPGPSVRGDIDLAVKGIEFGNIPVGTHRDTIITIGNTGGGSITVSEVTEFSDFYSILTAPSFVIAPGQTHDLGIRFNHLEPGYAGTFLRIHSDDSDEDTITIPLSADDNVNILNLGEEAPNFQLSDMDGVIHDLRNEEGRIVVMAFFANW